MGLTHEIERQRPVRALASALVTFAHETRATIVAEGIETHSQLQTLQDLGITCGQGYLLGRPADLAPKPGTARTEDDTGLPIPPG